MRREDNMIARVSEVVGPEAKSRDIEEHQKWAVEWTESVQSPTQARPRRLETSRTPQLRYWPETITLPSARNPWPIIRFSETGLCRRWPKASHLSVNFAYLLLAAVDHCAHINRPWLGSAASSRSCCRRFSF